MTTDIEIQGFLAKAAENLASASSELVNGRYNACANRCYYACFQAAIAALLRAGIRPRGPSGEWRHAYVQSQVAGELVTRRKLLPSASRDVLPRLSALREKADYDSISVSHLEAQRAHGRAEQFVVAVRR